MSIAKKSAATLIVIILTTLIALCTASLPCSPPPSLLSHSRSFLSSPSSASPLYAITSSAELSTLLESPRCFHLVLYVIARSSTCVICGEIERQLIPVAAALHESRFQGNDENLIGEKREGESEREDEPLHGVFIAVLDAAVPANVAFFQSHSITRVPRLLFVPSDPALPPFKQTASEGQERGEREREKEEEKKRKRRERYYKYNPSSLPSPAVNESPSESAAADAATASAAAARPIPSFASSDYVLTPTTVLAPNLLLWLGNLSSIAIAFNQSRYQHLAYASEPQESGLMKIFNSIYQSSFVRLLVQVVIVLLLILAALAVFLKFFDISFNPALFQSKLFFYNLSVFFFYFCVCGGMHNIIRGNPVFHLSAQHGLLLFHPGVRDQFIVESLLVALVQGGISVCLLMLTTSVLKTGPHIAFYGGGDGEGGKMRSRSSIEQENKRLGELEAEIKEKRKEGTAVAKSVREQMDFLTRQIALRRARNASMLSSLSALESSAASPEAAAALTVAEPDLNNGEWFGVQPATFAITLVVCANILFSQLRGLYNQKTPAYNSGYVDFFGR